MLDAGHIVRLLVFLLRRLFSLLIAASLSQVEFGSPGELLKNEKGMLRALVDESGDREKLYEMAKAASRAA